MKARIRRHDIPCDLKSGSLRVAYKPGDAAMLAALAEDLRRRYDYPHIRAVPRDEVAAMLGTRIYHGGSLDRDAGHLHPLNYALGLARAAQQAGARIFEDSPVTRIEDGAQPGATTCPTASTATASAINLPARLVSATP